MGRRRHNTFPCPHCGELIIGYPSHQDIMALKSEVRGHLELAASKMRLLMQVLPSPKRKLSQENLLYQSYKVANGLVIGAIRKLR